MDKSKGKRPMEGSIDVPMNVDLEDNNVKDDELLSVLRHSRAEHERVQNKRGIRMSDEAFERNSPAMVSSAKAMTIHLIARSRQISIESFLRIANPHSILIEDNLALIRGRYGFSNEVHICLPFLNERADTFSKGWIYMYVKHFKCGL